MKFALTSVVFQSTVMRITRYYQLAYLSILRPRATRSQSYDD